MLYQLWVQGAIRYSLNLGMKILAIDQPNIFPIKISLQIFNNLAIVDSNLATVLYSEIYPITPAFPFRINTFSKVYFRTTTHGNMGVLHQIGISLCSYLLTVTSMSHTWIHLRLDKLCDILDDVS